MESRLRRWLPAVIGLITTLVFAWVWGRNWRYAPIHDEASYLFQARVFASGRWTADPPPVPNFFEQMYVLVTPRWASIYFPGQSLSLVPGIWIGFPHLVPLVLLGVSGTATYVLASEVAGVLVGFLSWILWLTAPINPWFRPSYLSEPTSTAMWLLAMLFGLRWSRSGKPRDLLAVAVFSAFGILTRPLSMLSLAVPLGVVLVALAIRKHSLAGFGLALLIGASICSVQLVYSWKVTGSPAKLPYILYCEQYPSFVIDTGTTPVRTLPPDLERVRVRIATDEMRARDLPTVELLRLRLIAIGKDMWVGNRLWAIGKSSWTRWRLPLILFALIGLFPLPRAAWVPLFASAALVGAHLWYGHQEAWSKYYLEAQPLLAFLSALGIFRAITWAWSPKRIPGVVRERGVWMSVVVAGGVLMILAVPSFALERRDKDLQAIDHRLFAEALRPIGTSRNIVFVNYSRRHNVDHSLISNDPDWRTANTWIVYDRDGADGILAELAPERTAYRYEESEHTVVRMIPGRSTVAPSSIGDSRSGAQSAVPVRSARRCPGVRADAGPGMENE